MSDTKKRKRHYGYSTKSKQRHRRNDLDDFRGHHPRNLEERTQDSLLFIRAHEADVHRGLQARELARSLEVTQDVESDQHGTPDRHRQTPKIGSALIQWAGGSSQPANDFGDQEDTISLGTQIPSKSPKSVGEASGIWIDRFDARLLLDTLPDFKYSSTDPTNQSLLESPSGWSDLPSDTEEMFFFSPEEVADFRNEKCQRLVEQAQEERVKARSEEEKEMLQDSVNGEYWGDSDEEPDDTQKEFMRRTAIHLLSSPNPAQLEMRILANHGADKRFAFLKGRWSHAWLILKAKIRAEREEKERKEEQQRKNSLGMLANYDSELDEDEGNEIGEDGAEGDGMKADNAVDETKKELRRQKAKEWTERRRAQTDAPKHNENSK